MSGLLNSAVEVLRDYGYPQLDSRAENAFADAVAAAREFLGNDENAFDFGGPVIRAAALDGLDRVDVASPHLVHLATDEVKGLLEAVFRGLGADDTVRNDYFRLTYEERRAAMHATTDELAAETERRNAAWRAFQDMLQDVGSLALRTLIPLLLAAI